MPVVRYNEPLNIMVAAKGHPYLRDALMAMFDNMPGIACTLVEQPLAARLMTPEGMRGYDGLILYDMPGLDFSAADPPAYVDCPEEFQSGFESLLTQGIGIVALHHSIAGWPAWTAYGDMLGGHFRYRREKIGERVLNDSGYVHGETYEALVVDPEHPVFVDIPARFEVTDELYLFDVNEDSVTPLLVLAEDRERGGFHSASAAMRKAQETNPDWKDGEQSARLLGWTRRQGSSQIVYLQPGDGPSAFENEYYQRMIENALRWTCRVSVDPGAPI